MLSTERSAAQYDAWNSAALPVGEILVIRLLLAVGNATSLGVIRKVLENQTLLMDVDLACAATLEKGRYLLATQPFDLVIADHDLPDGSGLDLMSHLADRSSCPVPVLYLSGDENSQLISKALKNGAIDFVAKSDQSLQNLPRNIVRVMREWSHIQRRRKMSETLQQSQNELLLQNEKLQLMFDQVQSAKEEWEQTMDCLNDIIILTDDQGIIRRANDALLKLTGRKYEHLIGLPLADALEDCSLAAQEAPFRDIEMYHEGSGRWFILTIYDLDGVTLNSGKVITAHEYTRIRELNLQLERANRDLELKSDELAEALALQQTAQAKVIQQEKMATIGQLAAGVAHEINNPMGFILSNLGTINKYLDKLGSFVKAQTDFIDRHVDAAHREEIDGLYKSLKIGVILDDLEDVVDESIDGAHRVRKIVGDLKGFTRQEDAKLELMDVNEILASAINLVWNEIKYKSSLEKQLQDLPPIYCHPTQLSQVFMNLLVNAAHAIKEQGEIIVSSELDASGRISVTVRDNGCGIPEEIKSRIFEPFFTTKDVGYGTGLGLSISYDIVKEHGGEILVESQPMRGSAFTIKLPLETS